MIEVVIEREGQRARVVRLQGGSFVIGRGEAAELRLDDKEVSRRHARLLVDGDDVVVEDLHSANGTFVAGRPVRQARLGLGDVVTIEPFTLSLREPSTSPLADAAPSGPPEAWLQGTDGPVAGKRFRLEGEAMSVGRHDDQDIPLHDKGASRSHAMLVQRPTGWSIRDNGSANGLYVNDAKVTDHLLAPGDEISIGHSTLRYVVPSAVASRETPAPAASSPSPAPAAPPHAGRAVAPAPPPAPRPEPPALTPAPAPAAPAPAPSGGVSPVVVLSLMGLFLVVAAVLALGWSLR